MEQLAKNSSGKHNLFMTPKPDLTQLAKEIHKASVAKGFHKNLDNSDRTQLMLIVCELAEAVEADRGIHVNKRANVESFENRLKDSRSYAGEVPEITPERAYEVIYKETIKGSIEEELADATIRLLDLAALRNIEIVEIVSSKPDTKEEDREELPFADLMFNICGTICENHRDTFNLDLYHTINEALFMIEEVCKHFSIDLWLHVELKRKYNLFRPYKHGKQY